MQFFFFNIYSSRTSSSCHKKPGKSVAQHYKTLQRTKRSSYLYFFALLRANPSLPPFLPISSPSSETLGSGSFSSKNPRKTLIQSFLRSKSPKPVYHLPVPWGEPTTGGRGVTRLLDSRAPRWCVFRWSIDRCVGVYVFPLRIDSNNAGNTTWSRWE